MRFIRLAACFLAAAAAFAQTDRGAITGTVADPAGAVVANAMIELKNMGSAATYQGASTNTGNFTFGQLPIGNYELTVTVPGFKKYVRQNIGVAVASTTRVDVGLEVGAATESVTVTEQVTLLKTESGELSHSFTYDRANNLPIINLAGGAGLGNVRNPLGVTAVIPGAQFVNDNTLRVNGMPSSSQAIRIEGQDATNGIWRQLNQATQTSMDAIQEVAIQTSNFAAEYGQAGGGYFNYTMKSGTNQFHGAAYNYFVNEGLNAGLPWTARPAPRQNEHIRNKQRRNNFGFNLGGPIRIPKIYDGRDRSFFYFNFEQFREDLAVGNVIATVPTDAYRRGDFSSALGAQLLAAGQPAVDALGRPIFRNQIFDPRTQRLAPNGTVVRDAFPGNIVPTALLEPVSLKVQSYFPTATSQANVFNYNVPTYDNNRRSTIPSIKWDQNVGSNIKLSAFYSINIQRSPNANGFTQPWTTAAPQDQTSQTTRINYDQSITPTMLLHLGVGLLQTTIPSIPPAFNQSELGFRGNFYANIFPNFGGIFDGVVGGMSPAVGSGFAYEYSKETKPTANANLTWVRGNHTIKFGGELVISGLPTRNVTRANGLLNFAAQQSGNPWEEGQPLNATTGFNYASFLMGRTNSLTYSALTDSRMGNHAMGYYLQDTWKVTRKFTLDYGLRYDYVTLLKEQYGRMQSAAFDLPNPAIGNRLGTVIYEATCNCNFNRNYPHAWGPRLGAAYQINSKTVIRAGAGLQYGTSPNNAFLTLSVPDFYNANVPRYGDAATLVADGNIRAPGNRFGNPVLVWPDFTPQFPNEVAPGIRPPQSPFISIDRNAGRPPRIFTWSVGLQRELTRDLVVEAAYVGNRGAWWTAPLLATQNYNSLTPEELRSRWGMDITSATDRALMTTPISSPQVVARFPYLANPNNVYPGFPANQPLYQTFRPYPQWNGIPPFLGPPLGTTWYDSLQVKATKRYSHGVDVGLAYTWQKELTLGANSDTSYLTPQAPLINDVFNRAQNKQISGFSRPQMLAITFLYRTPRWDASNAASKALSWAARDWQIGGVLRYQSGQILRSAGSNNNMLFLLGRGAANNNPAVWGGGATMQNLVAGQPFLNVDPNCGCFDPTRTLVANPAAWQDAAPGQFGSAAPYYWDYRWQRQPQESLSLARFFPLAKENRVTLSVRAELFNVFNRTFLSLPTVTNPTAPIGGNVANGFTAGFGWVNTIGGAGSQPRTGQIVVRIQF